MYPTLLDLSAFSLSSYFTMIALGYVLAAALSVREGKRVGIDPDDVIDVALYGLIFGVLGARLLHVVADGFFWDYVHLCTDPFLVEGRDLNARPLSELQELGISGRLCTSDAQCLDAQTGGVDPASVSWWESTPRGKDVGALCNEETGLCHPEQDCLRWLMFWAGGMTFYGSVIAAFFSTCWLAARYRMGVVWAPKLNALPRIGLGKLPLVGGLVHRVQYLWTFREGMLKYMDFGLPLISLAHAFGRMGCFLAGCCFGSITDHPVGLRFPGGSPAYQLHRKEHLHDLMAQYNTLGEHLSLPVHPTQLYSVTLNLIIFAILWFWVRRRKQFHGQVAGTMLVMYGISRFAVEFFRADYRGELLGLSTSQWISLPLILIALYGLARGFSGSDGLIDDGGDPPLGKPLTETVLQPQERSWGGERVSPTATWREDAEALIERIRNGRSSNKDRESSPAGEDEAKEEQDKDSDG